MNHSEEAPGLAVYLGWGLLLLLVLTGAYYLRDRSQEKEKDEAIQRALEQWQHRANPGQQIKPIEFPQPTPAERADLEARKRPGYKYSWEKSRPEFDIGQPPAPPAPRSINGVQLPAWWMPRSRDPQMPEMGDLGLPNTNKMGGGVGPEELIRSMRR
jgi:hypothetical protein